jgi:murein DD-endopeptidase MepM/ murein hydrolase activator NlpD
MRAAPFSALILLAGCAASPHGVSSTILSQTPNAYTQAPTAALKSELFVCGGGANLGDVGDRGEVLAFTPYIFTPAGALLRDPTEVSCASSGFGWRGYASGGGRMHNGLDLANPDGGLVYAAGEGWVRFAGDRGGLGLVVEIDHGHNVRTLYAHLSEIDPNLGPGVFVNAGRAIARMGQTGNATGVHLHYEVSVDGVTVDPLYYGREPPPVL